MRTSSFSFLGAGLATLLGLGAQGACGGGDTMSAGGSSSTGTMSSSSGSGGASSSSTSSSSTGSSSSSTGDPASGDSVLTHHKHPNRDGLYVQPTLTKAAVATLHQDPTFAPGGLAGAVYAQPLFVDGGGTGPDLVIVVTEENNVYALDAATGAGVWARNLGVPVKLAQLPCGNLDPYGVTGTPAIDFASRTLFLDAELTQPGGTSTHQVFGLSVDTGVTRAGWPVDMTAKAQSGGTTFLPAVEGERGALLVLNGTVYVPFGGRYGDCGQYHGWVVGISIADPTSVHAWVTPARAGGIWMPGGISSDGQSLFVATGNTQLTSGTWGGGNAILRLTAGAGLGLADSFAPKNWLALDNGDLDLGSAPIIFDLPGSTPSTLALSFGKDGDAYLVDRTQLGGVGAALGAKASCSATSDCGSLKVATQEIITAPTLYTTATATYVVAKAHGSLCTNGGSGTDHFALKIVPGAPPTLEGSWCAKGGNGSPMVTTSDGHADAIVWTLGAEGDGHLHAFDGDTGADIPFTDSGKQLAGLRRYNTPIAAKGRIYVPVDGASGGVLAFVP
jgi:outer membrane protein assembly factor BamB